MSSNALKDIIIAPNMLPHRLDASKETLEFANVPAASFKEMTFHDGRDFSASQMSGPYPLDDVTNQVQSAGLKPHPETHYIFHSAFCCSTLLARALGQKDGFLSLREPNLMLDLANLKRFRHAIYHDPQRWKITLELALALFNKPAAGHQGIMIKPTNITNTIIPELLNTVPNSNAILLHSDLRRFLISLIKKGDAGLAYASQTLQILAMDSDFLQNIPGEALKTLDNLKIIALVWRLQMEAFAGALDTFPVTRVASLDSRHLIDTPAITLNAVSSFYGMGFDDKDIKKITDGPLFSKHAKMTGQSFDAKQQNQENQKIEDQYSKALDDVITWEKTLLPDNALVWPLKNPLKL